MKFLIKLFCLLSLLSSFGFAEVEKVKVLSKKAVQSLRRSTNEYGFLNGQEFYFFKSADRNLNALRSVSSVETYYILDASVSSGIYTYDGELFLVEGAYKTGLFAFIRSIGYTDFYYFGGGDSHSYTLAYNIHLDWGIDCQYSENIGIKSKKCFPACQAGESWDYEAEICYSDCSDKNLNKFGYSNGTAQGGCVDCSNALVNKEIASCICSGFGSTLPDSMVFINIPDSPFVSTSCSDGSSITFKKRSNENPDKDKDKKKDNNSTNSSDKDKENPKPDKKDNNENSNNSSGENGNPSNNNSGGSSGNGSSGGGGTGVETKPNPNHKGDGKEDGKGDGKQDGKGEEGKGDDAVAGKLDYGDLKKDADKFKSDFKGALDDVISKAQDFKNSLDGIISKIKEGGLTKFNQSSIPSTCPLSFEIDFVVSNKQIIFDICKVLAPVSQTLYYFFYIAFFILFLLLIVKLFLFTFMGL